MGTSLLALFVAGGVQLGFWTDRDRARDVLRVVRGGHGQGAPRRHGLPAGGGGDGPLRQRRGRPSAGSPCRWCCPGIVAAALLAFSLSFDDFIITNFNSGTTVTFPMYVWGANQRGIPPQVNVIGTAMFAIALLLVLASNVRRRRTARLA